MVEVFKTNVFYESDAHKLILLIHQKCNHYQANFDLEDCDRILRIKAEFELIDSYSVILLLKQNGFYAEVLTDDFEPITGDNF